MNNRKYIRAEEGKPPGISVVYYDTDGNKTIRYYEKNGKQGSHAWRNNNPGNLAWGSGIHAKNTGCIGKAKGRPVFPDYETGKQSMRLLPIESERWLLKDTAIAMAENGCLHAIVVHAKTGAYLRPEYGSKSFKELLC